MNDAESLLLVDDDQILRERLARAFCDRGFRVSTACGYDEALSTAREARPGRAVIDLKMPGRGGLELLRALLDEHESLAAVVLTGYGSIATAIEATRLGAVNYLQKPADADDILAAFERGAAAPLHPTTIDYDAPSLARAEWEHISRVLSDCGGNVSEAARRLGVHRRTLQRKLQKYPPQS